MKAFSITFCLALAACNDGNADQLANGGSANDFPELKSAMAENEIAVKLANEVEIFPNRIGYYVNEEAGFVCEGESWANYGGNEIAWNPESGTYTLVFSYRYDGQNLFLYNGRKFVVGRSEAIAKVPDRRLRLTNLGNGNWLMNGQSLTECR